MKEGAVLVFFARSVRAGLVKTRLMPTLDAADAAWVYERLLGATVARVLEMPFAARVLAVHPDQHVAEMNAAWPGFDQVLAQGPGDLGQKVSRIFAAVFAEYKRGGVVIGADAPDLPSDRIARACEQIALGRSAMCPTGDGGYCLIAMPQPQPALFDGIDWGSERVAAQTRDAARRQGIELTDLEPWHDVDTIEDVIRLTRRLKGNPDPHLANLRRGLISLKLPGITLEPGD